VLRIAAAQALVVKFAFSIYVSIIFDSLSFFLSWREAFGNIADELPSSEGLRVVGRAPDQRPHHSPRNRLQRHRRPIHVCTHVYSIVSCLPASASFPTCPCRGFRADPKLILFAKLQLRLMDRLEARRHIRPKIPSVERCRGRRCSGQVFAAGQRRGVDVHLRRS
jgi:hypothetical protein